MNRLLEFTNTQQQMPPICISEFDFFQHKGWERNIEFVQQKLIDNGHRLDLFEEKYRNDLILKYWNALSPRVTLLQNKRMPIWRLKILGGEK